MAEGHLGFVDYSQAAGASWCFEQVSWETVSATSIFVEAGYKTREPVCLPFRIPRQSKLPGKEAGTVGSAEF